MKKYCKKLKEWVMKIVNYVMKDMTPLTNGQKEYHEKQKNVSSAIKDFVVIKIIKILKIFKKFMIIVI